MKSCMLALALLAGCAPPAEPAKVIVDQCLRAQLFQQCMASLPKGPDSVHSSNDWNEVVDSCQHYAYAAAVRLREYVQPQCTAAAL